MTDAEIKKDLLFVAHCCHVEYNEIRVDVLLLNALDLINRQQEMIDAFIAGQETLQKALAEKIAEIERLNSDLRVWNDIAHRETEYVEIAKAEAIKEFAERVKMAFYYEFDEIIPSIMADNIDNLVKEMVGDAE